MAEEFLSLASENRFACCKAWADWNAPPFCVCIVRRHHPQRTPPTECGMWHQNFQHLVRAFPRSVEFGTPPFWDSRWVMWSRVGPHMRLTVLTMTAPGLSGRMAALCTTENKQCRLILSQEASKQLASSEHKFIQRAIKAVIRKWPMNSSMCTLKR